MAKNRLFGWMFVEDSNKESETIKPCTSQEASAVPSPVVTSVPAPTIMASGDVDTKLVELLERKINEANLPGPDYLELLQSAEQMKQYIPDETTRLKAAFGSILDNDARALIDREFVPIAKQFNNARVRIEGNTDNTGNRAYNESLSSRRAQAVANYLINDYGFDPNRFIIVGNGPKNAIRDGVQGSNINYRTTDFMLVTE